ncbi:hypothetical protein FRC06_004754 [Ceratobasidium sp. 370]|nr:hypothetical protein FRC06_004754 [Ceratobasidium sp. 370]
MASTSCISVKSWYIILDLPSDDDVWSYELPTLHREDIWHLSGASQTEYEATNIRTSFCRQFNENCWNYPHKLHPGTGTKPAERKALVIAIQYAGPYHLPGALLDANNVVHVLENRFNYPPECIRVLVDQLGPGDGIGDGTWPTKKNILNGLKWLGEECADGSRRFLYFTGHGYTSGYDDAEGGILPVDYRAAVRCESNNVKPVQVVIPKTMLSNRELNNCLANSFPDNKIALTVMLDATILINETLDQCNDSQDMLLYTLGPEDMTNIRGRHRFTHQEDRTSPEENGASQGYVLGFGNLLNLPVKINLASSNPIRSSEQVVLNIEDDHPNQREFKSFPRNCEVVSWYACERRQTEGEGEGGGMLTTAFVVYVQPADVPLSGLYTGSLRRPIFTLQPSARPYERLNRYILNVFNQGTKVAGESNGNTVHKSRYLDLYVSENIATSFGRREVYI